VNLAGESANSTRAVALPLPLNLGALVHRYTFSETGGSKVADSLGGPAWNGTLPNGGALAAGQLTLASTSAQYVSLPLGIVVSLTNFTIEVWARLNSTTNRSRLFDFGRNTTTNMFLTPRNGSTGRLRFAITTNGAGGEQQINTPSVLAAGVWYHIAVTLSGNTGILYLNGSPVGTNNAMTLRPSSLGVTENNYLGRSQYTADPYFDGLLDEFRIYNVALSPGEIAATAALGPNQVLSAQSPALSVSATAGSMTLTWPLASAGFSLQSRTNLTLGDWMQVTSPAPQIVGGQWRLEVPVASDTEGIFYRLAK